MRMEHKSPLPDIEFNPSPRPFESKERIDIQIKPHTDVISIPQQQQFGHTEQDHSVATKTFEKIRYTTLEKDAPPQFIRSENYFVQEKPDSNYDSQSKCSSVSQRIKTLEKCTQDQPVYKSMPIWNASNEMPIDQYHMEKQISTQSYHLNGMSTPNPIKDTLDKISTKMYEYEQNHLSSGYDLKAPALVKSVTPAAPPCVNGYHKFKDITAPPSQQPQPPSQQQHLNLQPGDEPEFCFAPRFATERKPSIVERMEKSLERELEKGPSKVVPHSVRIIPPSLQTVSSESFESSKRSIMKQTIQPEMIEQHKDFNQIKHNFHEHNKPLQRKTFDQVPPTQAPKV